MTTLLEIVAVAGFGIVLMLILAYALSHRKGIPIVGSMLIAMSIAAVVWGVVDGRGLAIAFGVFLFIGGVMTWLRRHEFLARPSANPFSKRTHST